jgi:serine/threonine protein phosphatase PrpC
MADAALLQITIASTIGASPENQDAVGIDGWAMRPSEGRVLRLTLDATMPHVIAVADGIGGRPAGALAAATVVAAVSSALDNDPPNALVAALGDARGRLAAIETRDSATRGLGSTLIAMRWSPSHDVNVVQVGDSLAFRFVDEYLGSLTSPHREESGDEAGRLTEWVGAVAPRSPLPTLLSLRSRGGARIVLCTDGVWEPLQSRDGDHPALADALADPDPSAAAHRVLDLVAQRGAPDNATLVIIDPPIKPVAG